MDARDKRGHDGFEVMRSINVITGLFPVIPLTSAQQCHMNRHGRNKSGHGSEAIAVISIISRRWLAQQSTYVLRQTPQQSSSHIM